MFRSSWLCLLCLLLAAFAGCPGGGTGVDTVAVTGTVTLDGQPVQGANVAFAPKSADGKAAAGLTDASGRFELTTIEASDGALPGSYAVTITKVSGTLADQAGDKRARGETLSPEEMEAMMKVAEGGAEQKSAIPEKYAAADTSGFTAEVKPGGTNDFPFDMTSE